MAVAAGAPDRTRSRKLTQRCSILGRDVVAKAADLYVMDAVLDGGEKVAAQQRLVLEPERVLWLQRVVPAATVPAYVRPQSVLLRCWLLGLRLRLSGPDLFAPQALALIASRITLVLGHGVLLAFCTACFASGDLVGMRIGSCLALDAVAPTRAVGRRNRVSVLGVLGGRLRATHWTLVLNRGVVVSERRS